VPVLEYHRFIPAALATPHVMRLDVPPTLFDAQLTALAAAGWHTITAAQLAQDLASGTRPAPKSFVITIDDGHEDGYTAALPILRAHGMVATYYVIAGRIDERHPTDPSMSSEQIRALVQVGMEIGNHTYSHVRLASLTAAQQAQEIASASSRIAAITGGAPTTMAYPFGSYDGATEKAAHDAGILLAFDSSLGARESLSAHLRSPRLHVGAQDSAAVLIARMTAFAG
jgi:peptidoglycan/xylan/chitin deacetylase (PgdA/CDA1 family)